MNQVLPSSEDFERGGNHFAWSARDDLLGKSLAEVEAMFRHCSLVRAMDLDDMGPAAFRFYVPAAIAYVRSADADGDSDVINYLASSFRRHLQHNRAEFVSIASSLADFCSYVASHIERFDASPEIYGDLRGAYTALATAFHDLAQDSLPVA